MESKNIDKILETIEKTCEKYDDSEKYFEVMTKIYNHLSKFINEPSNQRPESIKQIIDSNFGRVKR